MTTYNIGRVLPKWCGTYDPSTNYDELDIVAYSGSSYVSLANENVGVTPSDDSSVWAIVARGGSSATITDEQVETIKQQCLTYLQNSGAVFDAQYMHTDNNLSDERLAKLNGIEAGAEVNVQSDWNEDDTTSPAYIANKPSYTETDNNFSNAYKTKLDGIDSSAQRNVQSNWTELDPDADSYIQNKPTLSEVATTGSYNSLSNLPELFSGDYTDLTNKPTIPTRFSQLTNDQVFIVPPTVYNHGTDSTVNITSLNGNELHQCGHLTSLTISAYGDNTFLPTSILFETTPDVSLALTLPNNTYWVTEQPLFYAEENSQKYLLKIENNIAQLFWLTADATAYVDWTEDAARWSAASWGIDPENWADFVGIEPAEPLF